MGNVFLFGRILGQGTAGNNLLVSTSTSLGLLCSQAHSYFAVVWVSAFVLFLVLQLLEESSSGCQESLQTCYASYVFLSISFLG